MPTTASAAKPRTRSRRPARAAPAKGPVHAGISDAAVAKATGKGWAHWLKVLDRFDVKAGGHKAAAEHLHDRHGVSEWWSQMVVVGYEQARSLRAKHQKTDGFSISASRVIACPVGRAFQAWQPPTRSRWCPGPDFVIRRQTRNRSMRITWTDGKSNVDAMFYAKGPSRCSVAVQHSKLASAAAARRMKAFWGRALDGLKALVEP